MELLFTDRTLAGYCITVRIIRFSEVPETEEKGEEEEETVTLE